MTGRDAHARDWDVQFGIGMAGGWLRGVPDMNTSGVSLDSRRIGDGALRSRGGLAMIGIGGDLDLTVDDRWRLALGGVNFWWPVGTYDSVNTSLDGSIAHEKPWSASRMDVLLPGFGRRVKLRRNMVSFAIRTGASRLGMDGTVAAGSDSTNLELSRWTFLAQIEVEGCRRLDPTYRVCVQVVPRVYEHTFLNGLSIGFRMEWGR
jgi:hypothetical protein